MRRGRAFTLYAIVAGVIAGCVGAAADHEAFADEAYAEGRYGDALVEYRLAIDGNEADAELRHKAGAAALRAGDLIAAAREFAASGLAADAEQRGEATDGLIRVARSAIERGERPALEAALEGLDKIAPEAVLSGFAPEAVTTLGELPQGAEGLTVLLHAAAEAPDARVQDSLMLVYGRRLQRSGRCEDAVSVFESLVFRERARSVAGAARTGLVTCALQLGRAALDAGRPTAAETWFETAASRAGDSPAGRVAYLGLGDVRFALGDVLGAIEAYEQARAGTYPGDSVYTIVANRLNRIARPPSEIR